MPYDPDQHDRQSTRLPGWDYRRPAAYFVTICALSEARKCPQGRTHQRVCLFGEVIDGSMALNASGRIVAEEWNRSPSIRREIETDAFIVMPNHVHGIVIIAPPGGPRPITPDGYNVHVGSSRMGPPHGANHVGTHGTRGMTFGPRASLQRRSKSGRPVRRARSLGAFIAGFKSAATTRVNRHRGTPGAVVWQGRYYERIIRTEREWHAVRRYIRQNPARWHRDRNQPGRRT